MNFDPVTYRPGMTLDELERGAIQDAMRYYKGVKTTVARSLQITVKTLDSKLRRYADDDSGRSALVKEASKKQQDHILMARGIIPPPTSILGQKLAEEEAAKALYLGNAEGLSAEDAAAGVNDTVSKAMASLSAVKVSDSAAMPEAPKVQPEASEENQQRHRKAR